MTVLTHAHPEVEEECHMALIVSESEQFAILAAYVQSMLCSSKGVFSLDIFQFLDTTF
jgi:hypothetical protein